MKLIATGRRNARAQGSEVIVLGYAPGPDRVWTPAHQIPSQGRWARRPEIGIGAQSVSGLIGMPGASMNLRGPQPLLLLLMHPWSGIARFRLGHRRLEFDLYRTLTIAVVLDLTAGLAVEVNADDTFSGGVLAGVSAAGIDLLPDAVRLGRSFHPVRSGSSANPWPRRASQARIWYQRTPFFQVLMAVAWILARLRLRRTPEARDNIFLAVVEGLAKRFAGTPLPGVEQIEVQQPESATDCQVIVLSAMVEGLSARIEVMSQRRPPGAGTVTTS